MNALPPSPAALEPWRPPATAPSGRSVFARVLVALRPAVLPVAVGAISWIVSAHGGAHSVGDTIAPALIAAVGTTVGTLQILADARRRHQGAPGAGEGQPHSGLLAVRAGLVAWAVAGLSALAAADIYTANPALRILYTLIAAAAPVTYSRLVGEHRSELHLALTQRLALEDSAHRARITIEQLRQDGKTSRTTATQEHATIRARLKQDGESTRTEVREQHATARTVIKAHTELGARSAHRPAGSGTARALHAPAGLLDSLFALSPTAAAAIGSDAIAVLNAAVQQPADDAEPGGLYL
jgi:hypothetical protein